MDQQSIQDERMTRIRPNFIKPTLSSRRRLQNREAQRRYREKVAREKSCGERNGVSGWTAAASPKNSDTGACLANYGDLSPDPTTDLSRGDPHIVKPRDLTPAARSHLSIAPTQSSFIHPACLSLGDQHGILPPHQDGFSEPEIVEMNRTHIERLHLQRESPSTSPALTNQHQKPKDMDHNYSFPRPPAGSLLPFYHDQLPPGDLPCCLAPSDGSDQENPDSDDEAILTPRNLYRLNPTSTASPTHSGDFETPLLHIAVRSRNNHSIICMLLKHGASSVNDRDPVTGATALHVAASLGDEAVVSLLLLHGADINARDLRGQDPLRLAVTAGHANIVELILDKMAMGGKPKESEWCNDK